MMRFFIRDVDVGEDKLIINIESKGFQVLVGMVDFVCDVLFIIFISDMVVLVKFDVCLKGIGIMKENLIDSFFYRGIEICFLKLLVYIGVQIGRSLEVLLVLIGVGICIIDDELFCRKCFNRKFRVVVKIVDEIMVNRIDILFYRFVGVGDFSFDDNYFCNYCSNIEIRIIVVGEKIEYRNIVIGDFSVFEDFCCDRCSNFK